MCENSDVQLTRRNFVSITLNRKRRALTPRVGARPRLEASSNASSPNAVRTCTDALRSQLPIGLVQRILRGIPYPTLRANVECARSELRRHRLKPRRSHYRFLRIGETLRPSRFHCRAVEFVVL